MFWSARYCSDSLMFLQLYANVNRENLMFNVVSFVMSVCVYFACYRCEFYSLVLRNGLCSVNTEDAVNKIK